MTDQHRVSDPFSLAGKVAVITGASKNIGASLARGFAEAGADLLIVARGEEGLTAVADDIRASTGRQIETLTADVGEVGAAQAISEFADAHFPGVDILINNAYTAGSVQTSVLETEDSVWDEVLGVNLLGPFRLCREFGRRMVQRSGCSIINIVSGSGFLPTPNIGPYGVSKAALWMLTRYLAVEAAPHIRVNAVCPGIVSEDGEPFHDAQRALLPSVPMKRLGRPEEIVGAALYLAAPSSSYTTGEVIFVNGGRAW